MPPHGSFCILEVTRGLRHPRTPAEKLGKSSPYFRGGGWWRQAQSLPQPSSLPHFSPQLPGLRLSPRHSSQAAPFFWHVLAFLWQAWHQGNYRPLLPPLPKMAFPIPATRRPPTVEGWGPNCTKNYQAAREPLGWAEPHLSQAVIKRETSQPAQDVRQKGVKSGLKGVR